jgi:hypothetical protein
MVDEAEEDWGKKEMAITAAAKNRIMIFGPKTDGTYSRRRGVGDFNTENRDSGDPALPRAHALWAVCAGGCVR